MKNTYGKGTLGVERINMVKDDENNTYVFFMRVSNSDSEDESDVRFRQELIHQQLIGEIMDDNSKHFSDAPNHLSRLSIKALESTLHSEASTTRDDVPSPLARGAYNHMRGIRQDLRGDLRREISEHISEIGKKMF